MPLVSLASGRLAAALLAAMVVAAAPIVAQTDAGRALVGVYDGGQTDVAARLELRADGRFRYGLSYGALDEEAAGRWAVEGDRVMLTADPVVPPRLVLLGRGEIPAGGLRIGLDLPDGLSRQYFRAEVRLADGRTIDRQLSEEEDQPIDLPPGARAVAVTLLLPIAELRGGTVELGAGTGQALHFRFEPHDLGKVAFARTPLRIEHGDLLLARHDLILRFRRSAR